MAAIFVWGAWTLIILALGVGGYFIYNRWQAYRVFQHNQEINAIILLQQAHNDVETAKKEKAANPPTFIEDDTIPDRIPDL